MTRVDFYVIDNPDERRHARLVCRLAEKAWREGHRVHMRCRSEAEVDAFDALLWTFKDTAFVPHARSDSDEAGDVAITIGGNDATPDSTAVLINLGEDVPAFFSRFDRVMETTGIDDAERSAARERYRFYQERGYTLKTHKLDSARG